MPPQLAVAHYTTSLVRGGAEEHILTLLRGLDRQTFRLTLICPDPLADLIEADLPGDVRLERLLYRGPHNLTAGRRLMRILRGETDVLHSHLFYSSLFASPMARSCGVPLIVETPHLREQWRTGPIKSRFFVDRFISRFVDRYIAVSEANSRYLIETKRLPPEKVTIIPNGCDVTRFKPIPIGNPGLRQSLGFADDEPVLLIVGRLEPQKGHRVLLEALARVLREAPRTRLVCVGDGRLRVELEEQVRRLGLSTRVLFVGFQSHVEDWLALADFTVLPSFWEGLPLAAIESLAAGRTVVASAVDGTVEAIRHERTGLTVPPGDTVALAAAILRLLRDRNLREHLAVQGRAWVEEHFTQERQVRRTHDLYLSTWEQSPRRHRAPVRGEAPNSR